MVFCHYRGRKRRYIVVSRKHFSGFGFLHPHHPLHCASLTLLLALSGACAFILLQCVSLFACFIMTLPPLLFEMQHPVWNFTARSAHNIDNGPELPGVILSVESDSLTCSTASPATDLKAPLNGLMITTTALTCSACWSELPKLNNTQFELQPE